MCPRRNGLAKGTVIAFALIVLPTREQDVVPPKQRRMQEARDRRQMRATAMSRGQAKNQTLLQTLLDNDDSVTPQYQEIFLRWIEVAVMRHSGHVTEQVPAASRDNQSKRLVNIKKDILAPLNAACKWDADTNSWILPNTPEQPLTICRNWKNALGDKYPRGADVTRCLPTFFLEEADANQHGAPRLDLVLSFSNGDTVRYHPGATPISSRDPQPTDAMQARINRRRKLQAQS